MCNKPLQGRTRDYLVDRRRFLKSTAKLAALGPAEALSNLMASNARCVSGDMNPRDFSASRAALAKDQQPIAAVLCCAD